jgi:hypothetical protein
VLRLDGTGGDASGKAKSKPKPKNVPRYTPISTRPLGAC